MNLPKAMKYRFRILVAGFVLLAQLIPPARAISAVECRELFSPSGKREQMAHLATGLGLRYLEGPEPGIQRIATDEGFRYLMPDGKPAEDATLISRIDALKIPPGYRDVWISINPLNHLQATGFDSRGRKQYRYHANWTQVRDDVKFQRIEKFGRALPGLRDQVARDLAREGLAKDRVLAGVVQLLEKSLIRVGNEEYAKENESYGLTTMLKKHMTLTKDAIEFSFVGKSGVQHEKRIEDSGLTRLLNELSKLPGDRLFQWVDAKGVRHEIDSTDVNGYIKRASGGPFSAKDFRTWKGTTFAIQFQFEAGRPKTETEATATINAAVEFVAQKLGNTPAVSRESYIHPSVLRLNLIAGELEALYAQAAKEKASHVPLDEAVALRLLANSLESNQ